MTKRPFSLGLMILLALTAWADNYMTPTTRTATNELFRLERQGASDTYFISGGSFAKSTLGTAPDNMDANVWYINDKSRYISVTLPTGLTLQNGDEIVIYGAHPLSYNASRGFNLYVDTPDGSIGNSKKLVNMPSDYTANTLANASYTVTDGDGIANSNILYIGNDGDNNKVGIQKVTINRSGADDMVPNAVSNKTWDLYSRAQTNNKNGYYYDASAVDDDLFYSKNMREVKQSSTPLRWGMQMTTAVANEFDFSNMQNSMAFMLSAGTHYITIYYAGNTPVVKAKTGSATTTLSGTVGNADTNGCTPLHYTYTRDSYDTPIFLSRNTGSSNTTITKIIVSSEYITAPTISQTDNTVTITSGSSNKGNTVTTYYTTDGSIPTSGSSVYSEAITLTQSCTIKAISISSESVSSDVTELSCTYTPTTYNITVTQPESGGTVSVKVGNADATNANTTATAGQTITLSNTPAENYTFTSYSVTKTVGGEAIELTESSFTMPEEAVTITATFTNETPSEDVVSVFLTAGQSNTAGRASNDDLPDYIKTLGTNNSGAYQYCNWSYTNGTTRKSESEGVFRKFWPEMESANKNGRFAYDAIVYYWIEQALQKDFYVVKHAAGGTSIDPSCTSTNDYHWSADDTWLSKNTSVNAETSGKSMLKAFVDNIGKSLDAITTAGKTPDVKAMIWHQGESDRSGDAPANYKNNLKAVIKYVRDYLVDKTRQSKYATLDIIAGTVPSNSKQYNATVRQALTDLASEDSHFHVIETNPGTFIGDQLHFDTNCAERLGIGMYNKMVELNLVEGETQTVPEVIYPANQPVTLDFKTWAADNIGTDNTYNNLTLSSVAMTTIDGKTQLYKAIGSDASGDFSEFAETFALAANTTTGNDKVRLRGNVGLQLNKNQTTTFSILNVKAGDGVTITFGAGSESVTTLAALSENIFLSTDETQTVLAKGTALTSKTVTYVVKTGTQIDLTFGSSGGHYINSIVIEPNKVEILPTEPTIGDPVVNENHSKTYTVTFLEGETLHYTSPSHDGEQTVAYSTDNNGSVKITVSTSGTLECWTTRGSSETESTHKTVTVTISSGDDPTTAITVHTIGDSTMAHYEDDPQGMEGWGDYLGDCLKSNWATVKNYAICGKSSVSFYSTWTNTVKSQVQEGDVVIIQFGHNDNNPEQYTEYMGKYVDEVKALNAIPIIATSICRLLWNDSKTEILRLGRVDDGDAHSLPEENHSYDYPYLAKQVASNKSIKCIDVTTAVKELFEDFGPEKAPAFFPAGQTTHTNELGAQTIAKLAANLLLSQETALKDYVDAEKLTLPNKEDVKVIISNFGDEDVVQTTKKWTFETLTTNVASVESYNGLYLRGGADSHAIQPKALESGYQGKYSDDNETEMNVSTVLYSAGNIPTISTNTAGKSNGLDRTFALNVGTSGTFYALVASASPNQGKSIKLYFSGEEQSYVDADTQVRELKFRAETTGVIYICANIAFNLYAAMFLPDKEGEDHSEEDWNHTAVTTGSDGWATYSNLTESDQLIPDGLTAYAISAVNSNGKATLVDIGNIIPSGVGVIVKGTANTQYSLDGELPSEYTKYSGLNLMISNSTEQKPSATSEGKTNYVFVDGTTGFQIATGELTVREKQAYLSVVSSTAETIPLAIQETISLPTFTINGNSVTIANGTSSEAEATIKTYYKTGTESTAPEITTEGWTEYTSAITMTTTGYVYAYSKNTATNVTSAVAVSVQVVIDLSAAVTYDFMGAYAADNTLSLTFASETDIYYQDKSKDDGTQNNRKTSVKAITTNVEALPVNSRISFYNADQTLTAKGLSTKSGRPFAIHNLKAGDIIRIEFDGALYYAKAASKGNALKDVTIFEDIKDLKAYTVSSIDADNNYVVFYPSATTTISQISINQELVMKILPKPTVSSTYTPNDDYYTYTINYLEGATLHYTLPGGTEQTKAGGESLNVNVTKIGDLKAYATLNAMTSETASQRVYAPTPAIASGGVYDFALVKETMLKDYTLGTLGYGDAVTIGGVAMKKPDAVVAKTLDCFAFTSEYTENEQTKDGKEWLLRSAGRLRANATHDNKMAILNVKQGQYLTITYKGEGAVIKYSADGSAKLAEGTDVLTSEKGYEIKTGGDLLLTIPANAKACDIYSISLASTETVTAPTIEARDEINKVTLRLGTSNFGKTVTAYYTIDGSNPTTSSTAVTKNGAITVDETCTIKAYCVSETGVASGVTEYKVSLPAASKSASVVYDWQNLALHSDTLKFATDGLTVYDKEYDSTKGWETKKRTDFLAATNLDSKVSVRNGYKGLIYDNTKKTIRLTKPLAIHNLAVDDEIVIIYTGDGSLYSGAADEGDVFTVNGKAAPAGTAIPSGAVIKVTKQKYENNYVVVTPSGPTSGKVYISAIYINHASPTVVNTPKAELASVDLDRMTSTYRFTFDEGAMLYYKDTKDNEVIAGSNTGTFDLVVAESAKLKAWEMNGTLVSDTLSVTVYAPTPAPSTTGNFDFSEASEDLPADIEVTLDASKSVTVGGETLYKPSALTAATFGDKFAFTETGSSNKIRIRTNHHLMFAKGTNMSMGLLNLKKGDIIAFNYTGSITFADPSQVSVESPAVAARAMTRTVSNDMTSGTAYVVQADGNILLNLNLTEESTSISKMYIAAAPTAAAPAAIDFATASENYEEVETGSSTSVYVYGKSSAQTFKRLVNSSDELPIDGMISTEAGSGEITADGIKAANRHIAIHNLAAGDKITISFFGGALTYGGHETYGNRVSVDGKTLAAQDTLTSGDVMVVEKVDYLNNYVVLKLDSKCCISGIFINRDEDEKVWAPTIVESGKNTVLITAGRSSLGYQVTTYYTTDGTDPSDRNGIGGPYDSYDVELLDGSLVPVKAISYSASGKASGITTFNIFADTRTEIIGVPVEDGKEQVIYDLQGRKVESPMEGRIYIIDGKKKLYRRK